MSSGRAGREPARFRASSPKFARLREATELTLDTPGASLAVALDYYRIEAPKKVTRPTVVAPGSVRSIKPRIIPAMPWSEACPLMTSHAR